MNEQNTLIRSAVAGILAIGLVAATTSALAEEPTKEKCYGVAKAGKNDCGSKYSKHACAGQAKVDNDPNDFKLVPKGSCTQMGGKMEAAGEMMDKKK
ncbi:MAG TPA: DUF2282 domain-containing protein [Rhodocyclaceae bacterium]